MNRVDFYVLSDEAPEANLRCACRLIEKAIDQGLSIYVQVATFAEAQRFDELLWTCSDRTFVPHEIWDGSSTPHALVRVLIGERPAPASHRQLLINCSGTLPAEAASYIRIAEIVATDAERKRQSRERFKKYRENGCAIETHNL